MQASHFVFHDLKMVLASSSCVITIIETYDDDEVFDAIDMMNGFRANRKHLHILIPNFEENMFKNITINFAVTIEHSDGGDVNEIVIKYGRYISSQISSFPRSNCYTLSMPGIRKEACTGDQGSVPIAFTKPAGKKDKYRVWLLSTIFYPFPTWWCW